MNTVDITLGEGTLTLREGIIRDIYTTAIVGNIVAPELLAKQVNPELEVDLDGYDVKIIEDFCAFLSQIKEHDNLPFSVPNPSDDEGVLELYNLLCKSNKGKAWMLAIMAGLRKLERLGE